MKQLSISIGSDFKLEISLEDSKAEAIRRLVIQQILGDFPAEKISVPPAAELARDATPPEQPMTVQPTPPAQPAPGLPPIPPISHPKPLTVTRQLGMREACLEALESFKTQDQFKAGELKELVLKNHPYLSPGTSFYWMLGQFVEIKKIFKLTSGYYTCLAAPAPTPEQT